MSFYLVCELCKNPFTTRRQYTMHINKCNKNHQHFLSYFAEKNNTSTLNNDDNTFVLLGDDDDLTAINNIIESYTTNFPESLCLLNQKKKHIDSGNNTNFSDDSQYRMGVKLLALLKRAKAPNYLFDELVSFMKDSFLGDNLHVSSLHNMSRKRSLDAIKIKYNFAGLQSKISSYHCVSQHLPINVVWHDFGQCLYSLLTDSDLMNPDNLLDEINPASNKYDDITSGSVYINYYKKYIKNPNEEKLIPIIFFTDKTHTDNHGRLCLEPVQFTLGIFNKKTRDQSRAWRTLGYATESIYKVKITSTEKQQDYHNILKIILNSFIDYQNNHRVWEFKCIDGIFREKKMFLPVLFIIGDTEGHDKLCGRYLCRNKINRPCRYCNISFENSDKPDTNYIYTRTQTIQKLIENNNETKLNDLSMLNVKNTMHLLEFCDDIRGIHGAVLAEVLHCLQLGIFQYSIEQLFKLKKMKKTKKNNNPTPANDKDDDDDDDDEFEYTPENDPDKISSHWCFPDVYKGKFEDMCVFMDQF